MDIKPYGVYVRIDENNCIIEINSDDFLNDFTDWIKIDEGFSDKYHHAQGNYLPDSLVDEKGVYRYKLIDNEIVERTEEEKNIDYIQFVPYVSETEQIANIVFVALAETGTIDLITASEHPSAFLEWKPEVYYTVGQIRRYEDKLYRCVQEHTSQFDWMPDITPSLWVIAADPAEEWPEWSQPIGAHDAYQKGDKVSYNRKHYISILNNNIWAPDIYGWEEEGNS